MSLQVVTFENTLEASRDRANLGHDMDIVVGVFDDSFLKEHSCSGLEFTQEPLYCAVPVDSDLAHHECIALDDLHDHSLMLIRRGWNESIDVLRDEILEHHPLISLVDFPQYRIETFNQCANEDHAIATLALWDGVHPLLKTLPTDWGRSVSYGLLHSPQPAEYVQEFLNAISEVLESERADNSK